MKLDVHYNFLPKKYSVNAAVVMDHFGIDFEQGRHVIAEGLELPLEAGDVVLFTGPSGSGKSSLMRAVAEQLGEKGLRNQGTKGARDQRRSLVWIDRLELPDCILADALPLAIEEALKLLALCGLSEAQLLLRTPSELSDGQRYRFRLAYGLAVLRSRVQGPGSSAGSGPSLLAPRPLWLVADEFTATLDRTLAKVIAYNVRRLSWQTGTGFLLATTHEDITEDLNPDVLVRCDLDGNIAVERRCAKKNRSVSLAGYGSVRAPEPIGLTSLGGIIAATTLVPCGG